VGELESALPSLSCDDLLPKGILLCFFLEQTLKLVAIPESMVRELLQGSGREQVTYQIVKGRGWKRAH
jgi:hypothetical protein